ncbi:hypothetical protein BTA51_10015 [Hahella sp. CCB-MM4]|uniref:hypothetical protein n=1 Tax=Hahella sp. (strain CCB-MM4) TaxID=1926491 RepID=UPI000B9AFC99|nr:hypothetical protein [Hahella sp. CCB-MM4]OZG73359.1 hypothetical protein BTA51_10015 [Hahella sp. CCB-MM4]
MGVVISFRKDELSADDVIRYFFHEINEKHQLDLSLSDPRIKPHLPALRSLADVYIHTATNEVTGIPDQYQKPLIKELNLLRARFLAETVLGILASENIVHIKTDSDQT